MKKESILSYTKELEVFADMTSEIIDNLGLLTKELKTQLIKNCVEQIKIDDKKCKEKLISVLDSYFDAISFDKKLDIFMNILKSNHYDFIKKLREEEEKK